MSKDEVLKELYDQCEYQSIYNECGVNEDCEFCFINHAIEYIEEG